MREFIIGTDWWDDCDDVVALRLMLRAAKKGEIAVKAIGINAAMQKSVCSLDGFLNLEGSNNIPIGIDHSATDIGGNITYQHRLAASAKKYTCNDDALDAVKLYRKTLAEASGKVEIVEIGFLQVLAGLLLSEPDEYSHLNGIDLVRTKVTKVWSMAGKWDEQGGRENNIFRTEASKNGAKVVCEKCPVPITFLGFEIGYDVITGDVLEKSDHLHTAMCDYGANNGRESWDPMLCMLALVGDEEKAGYKAVCGKASINVDTGENFFEESENGLHKYVIKTKDNDYYKNLINNLIK